jgi:exopolysaccharide biosynthesis polyprenyl glycosylphosphotransferase
MSKTSALRLERCQSRLIPGRTGPYVVPEQNAGSWKVESQETQFQACHIFSNVRWPRLPAASLILPIGAAQRRQWGLPFHVIFDVLLIVCGFTLAQALLLLPFIPKSSGWRCALNCFWLASRGNHFGVALIFGALVTLFSYTDGAYQERKSHAQAEYFSLFKAFCWASLLVAVAFRWSAAGLGHELSLAVGAPASLIVLCLSRFGARRLPQSSSRTEEAIRNVLIVGANRTGRALADYLENDPQSLRRVKGLLDDELSYPRVLGKTADLSRVARAEFVDEVIVALPHDAERTQRVLVDALQNQLDVKIVPEAWRFVSDRTHLEEVGPFPLLKVHEEPIPVVGLAFKRTLDVLGAAVLLLLLSPLMAALGIAIWLDSPGSILYSAMRVGRKGRRFRCHKFRTMVANADEQKDQLRQANERRGPTFKVAHDPRITRIGRLLRRFSLDELPQLWNVLKGDMSLVGPRPHPLDDFARYDLEHLRRLDVTPGLTGLWQVSARSDPSFQKNMNLDLEYIENWSLLMDLRILLRTVKVVLAGSGA